MLSFLSLPAKIMNILNANISPREIAFGVCLALFLGFTPLNGTTALLLALFFFIFKINRAATLLTLPVFKMIYIAGASKLCDGIGTYLLEKADILTGLWSFLTHLPVIAYVDLNRTTVVGGLLLSAVLSVPLYFISKMAAVSILAAYSKKMQNSAFSKWLGRFKTAANVSSMVGGDISSTMKNVKSVVTKKLFIKVRSAIIKPKSAQAKTGFMKRLNIGGIAAIIVALLVIQFGVGLIISPMVSAFVIDALNKNAHTKISVEKVNVWPLTLSFSVKELQVFDPNNPEKRVARIGKAHLRISPIALLSKRLVISSAKMKDAELDLLGYSDGTYNIQHLTAAKAAKEAGPSQGIEGVVSAWKGMREKRDLFGNVYGKVKNTFSKKAKTGKSAPKVTRVTKELPEGKIVSFRAPQDNYLFEIRKLSLGGKASITPYNSEPVELNNMKLALGGVAIDPEAGSRIDRVQVRGALARNGSEAGKVDVLFSKSRFGGNQSATAKVKLENVDLNAVRFVYQDSLPVNIVKGRVSLSSVTDIKNDALDSRNSITLTGHEVGPKQGGAGMVGYIPIGAVCNALNQIDPVRLKFDITGTVEKPQFKGFQEMLLTLIKPYLANLGEQVKAQGVSALGQFFKKTEGQ